MPPPVQNPFLSVRGLCFLEASVFERVLAHLRSGKRRPASRYALPARLRTTERLFLLY